MAFVVEHQLPREDLALGVVVAQDVVVSAASAELDAAVEAWVASRCATPLPAEDEERRRAVRDLLRNGVYKPTGRGKPANEYLLRAAQEGAFPRINGLVDANNLISLKYMVPVSLWDTARTPSAAVVFRLGRAGEGYVFNPAGQILDLTDLICGAASEQPCVTPVKDSLATKVTDETTAVAGCIYFPLRVFHPEIMHQAMIEFLDWLKHCGPNVTGHATLVMPQQTVQLG